MLYKKINLELIVLADDADAVVAELNSTLDTMDEKGSIFGGNIETITFNEAGITKKSAVTHTINASETAIKAARKGLTTALRAIV